MVAGIIVQQLNPPIETGAWICIPAFPLPVQLPANSSGMAAGVRDVERVPALWFPPGPALTFSFSLSLCPSTFQINIFKIC